MGRQHKIISVFEVADMLKANILRASRQYLYFNDNKHRDEANYERGKRDAFKEALETLNQILK